jgi:hypothetical protein
MGSVVKLKSVNLRAPPRHPALSAKTFLVGLFPSDRVLVDFAKHLYRRYGILTVGDWDAYGPRLFEDNPLEARSRRRFLRCVGAPVRPGGPGAAVISLETRKIPICG